MFVQFLLLTRLPNFLKFIISFSIQILVWIDALISAHTITFATNNSMKSTIKDLGTIANDQVLLCNYQYYLKEKAGDD